MRWCIAMPCELEELQRCPPRDACQVTLCADFLFHCHIEEHMMRGLVGAVRARQKIWITDEALKKSDWLLPFDCCGDDCAPVDLKRCLAHRPQPPRPDTPPHGDTHAHGARRLRCPPPARPSTC